MVDREDCLFLAKVAEQAERFDGMLCIFVFAKFLCFLISKIFRKYALFLQNPRIYYQHIGRSEYANFK